MIKNVIITKEDNTLTILTKGLGLNKEQGFFQAMQDAWDEGYRLPTEVNRNNASYRVFKGAIKGRCIMFKDVAEGEVVVETPVVEDAKEEVLIDTPVEDVAVETPLEEVKEEEVVVDTPKKEAKPTPKKAGRPQKKKNK